MKFSPGAVEEHTASIRRYVSRIESDCKKYRDASDVERAEVLQRISKTATSLMSAAEELAGLTRRP